MRRVPAPKTSRQDLVESSELTVSHPDAAEDDQPYLDLGRRIGRLLEETYEAADDVKRTAQTEAITLLQETRRDAAQIKDEAERIMVRARSEARSILEDARARAKQLWERGEIHQREAEAVAIVHIREAQRDAQQIKTDAHRRADEIVEKATARIAERVRQLERRITTLQLTESEFEARLRRLQIEATTEPD